MSDKREWTNTDFDYESVVADKCYGKSGPGMYFIPWHGINLSGQSVELIPSPGEGLCIGNVTRSPNGFIYEVLESEQ